jgi:hypothetical protein
MDMTGLIDERVPGVAAVIDDFVEGFEDAVRQPVRPHELPDIFLRVELRRTQRQEWSRGHGWEVGGVTVYVASKSRHWPFWAALRAAGVRGAPGLLPGPMRSQAGWLG